MNLCIWKQNVLEIRISWKRLSARDPSEAKALGLQVLTKKSEEITALNLCYKPCGINLCPDLSLCELLLSTEDKYLVEAAGYDLLFAIGLWPYKQGDSKGCKVDETAFDIYLENWPRINLLRISLMRVKSSHKNSDSRRKDCSNFSNYYFSAAIYLNG